MLEELLFPRRCPVCLDIVVPKGAWICDACRDKLIRVSGPCCFRCRKPLRDETEEFCADCRKHKRSFVTGIAGYDYRSVPVRRMISRVKYHNERQLLDYPCLEMGRMYREKVSRFALSCLVPVPLHISRRRKRGFNQAEEIARRLGEIWELPVEKRLLVRCRKTAPQKNLNEEERSANLSGAFSVRPDARGVPVAVGLVDDIYTTGSTMEACTRALLEAGVEEVYSIALAVVP